MFFYYWIENESQPFTLDIHPCGRFVDVGIKKKYISGKVDYLDNFQRGTTTFLLFEKLEAILKLMRHFFGITWYKTLRLEYCGFILIEQQWTLD